MHIRRTTLACVPLFLCVAVGCSDDEDRLTEDEFVEQANTICADGNEEIEAAISDVETGPDGQPAMEDVIAIYEDTIVPTVSDQIDDLQGLNPPEDMEADIDALLEDAEAAVDDISEQLDEDAEAFFAGDDPFADVNARATELGLDECGGG